MLFKPGERAISRPFQTKRPVSVPGRVTSPRSPPWPETVLFRPPLFRLPGCVRRSSTRMSPCGCGTTPEIRFRCPGCGSILTLAKPGASGSTPRIVVRKS